MPEPDDESRKKLGADVAKAMVSGVLAASPRVDAFSTWLLGVTAGFLVLIVANIEHVINIIKPVPVKSIIIVLVVSAVLGLIQKVSALLLYVQTDIDKALRRKVSETVKDHSGETIQSPYRYVGEYADTVHLLVLFVSAFPEWLQKILTKMIVSKRDVSLSHLQRDTRRLVRQFVLVGLQIFCLLVSVVIVVFNL